MTSVRLAFALILSGFAGAAHAADALSADCRRGRSDPSRSIPACTALMAQRRSPAEVADAYYNRGIAYAKNDDLPHALADLDQAVQRNARWAFVYEDRAEVESGLGRFPEAIADFSTAIRLDPHHAFRFHGRAHAFASLGRLDAALQDFDTAIAIDPRDFRFFDRGVVLLAKGLPERALADFDETIRRNPQFAVAYAKRGLALLALGQGERALAAADQAIAIDPKDAQNHLVRGLIREGLGDPAEALTDVEAALFINPSDPDALAADARLKRAPPASVPPTAPQAVAPPVVGPPAPSTVPPAAAAPQTAEPALRRIALVIGNGGYASVGALPNATSDAEAMARLFRQDGFAIVEVRTDLGVAAFRHALADTELLARNADIAVVYFSGHGIEVAGRNYLVPVDARLTRDVDADDEAVPLDRVLAAVAGARQLRLVILDACRSDPFNASMQGGDITRSITRGLARIEPGSKTLVAYSAAAGTVAQDGPPGQHSPFTEALLKDLALPDLDIRLALGRVHDDVLAATQGVQEPYTYGALGGAAISLNALSR